jgi:hypothetical protein
MAGKFTNERIEQDYEDDDSPNKEPIKIPKDGRKGDGLGCREHDSCRHNHKANDGEHSRTMQKKKRRRAATQEHPRNVDERYSLEEWMGMMKEAGYSLEEGNKENKEKKNAYTDSQSHKRGEEVIASNHPDFIRMRGRGVVQGRIPSKTLSKDTEGPVSENTISRLQELAGIKQLNS